MPTARWQEEIEEADSNTGERLSDYSSRVESIRGHPSGAREYAEAAAWTSHSRKKQQVQSYVRRERAEKTAEEKQTAQKEKESSRFRKNQETAEQSMEGFREEIKGKIKREQLHKEQKKQAEDMEYLKIIRSNGVSAEELQLMIDISKEEQKKILETREKEQTENEEIS